MKWMLDILRGIVIGLANVIPGVSGGTMMVSMGIYDKLIYSINNLFKKFKECFKILLPYLIGMVLAIVIGAFTLKKAFNEANSDEVFTVQRLLRVFYRQKCEMMENARTLLYYYS